LDDFIAPVTSSAPAVLARRSPQEGRPFLAAAWGVACGMMYSSFFGQLVALGEPDPSGVPSSAVVAFKGALLTGCIISLVGALRTGVRGAPPLREHRPQVSDAGKPQM
jgi:hypothetical protein